MRILLVSRSTPLHHLGGMETVAWALASEFARLGSDVSFLTTSLRERPAPFTLPFTLEVLDAPPGVYSRAWSRESRKFARTKIPGHFDVVMGVGGGAHSMLPAVRKLPGAPPVVIQSHGTPWGEIQSKLAERTPRALAGAVKNAAFLAKEWRLSLYSQIITVGPAVDAAMGRRPMAWFTRGVPRVNIENGVDERSFRFDNSLRTETRASLGIPEDAIVAVSVGRVSLQKGIQQSLEAFSRVSCSDPRWRYVVVGDGSDLPAARRLAHSLGVAEKVLFVGPQLSSAVTSYLCAGDVFLFATLRQEGLAVAPLEAAANGLVAVVSRHAVPEGVDCIAVDPYDAAAVAKAMGDGASRTLAERKSTLPAKYTLARAASRYLEVFARLQV